MRIRSTAVTTTEGRTAGTVAAIDQGLRRCHRLRNRTDFERVRSEGRTFRGRLFTVGVRVDPLLPTPRLGVITSRRVGPAVVRNRLRRRVREAFRRSRPGFAMAADVVVIPRPEAGPEPCATVERELEKLWTRAGLLAPPSEQPPAWE